MFIKRVLFYVVIAGLLLACAPSLPAASDFTTPAVGTPIPGGHEESVSFDLAADQSGALVINQTGHRIQVAVSNTITSLGIGEDFLFVLAPDTYQFYIYRSDSAPYVHSEKLEAGKLRYLYLTPLLGNTTGK
jgi:hypothetical protein